jgi:tetratricopeptide (TPR) repeat protein
MPRIAILRFENLGPDASSDWMGRAFSEVISNELQGAPDTVVISAGRLQSGNASMGGRLVSAPGISTERAAAQLARASEAGYGEYAVSNGRVEARLTVEDLKTGRMTKVALASGPATDIAGVASDLAKQIAGRVSPYGTRSEAAVHAYVSALEAPNGETASRNLQAAIDADPNFGIPYPALARWKAQHQDLHGALSLLDSALARGTAIPELDRARIEAEAATLRGDAAGRWRAQMAAVKLNPNDPAGWLTIAETQLSQHEYAQSAQAYRKFLELEPEDANAWNQYGYVVAYAGDLKAAETALSRSHALRPSDANPIDSLGDVNAMYGRLQEAESHYLEALKTDPNFLNQSDLFKAAMTRLMAGDVAGADALAKQYADARTAAHDPLVAFRNAEWSWVSGRRKEACRQLEAFVRSAENGPSRESASRGYAELAIWNLVLGDRAAAQAAAQKSAALAGPSSFPLALVARFLAQAQAPAAEWVTRAEQQFPNPQSNYLKDLALSSALLLEKQFPAASDPLQRLYAASGISSEIEFRVPLAWTMMASGREQAASLLLRFNPIPSQTGAGPFTSFSFPRIYYLRGLAAQRGGKAEEARSNFQLFLKLSGPEPLVWGEEAKAKAGL